MLQINGEAMACAMQSAMTYTNIIDLIITHQLTLVFGIINEPKRIASSIPKYHKKKLLG